MENFNKRKKVLLVSAGMNRGGIETFLMNIIRKSNSEKIQFSFLLENKKNDYDEEIKKLNCVINYIEPRNKGYFKYLKNINHFFKLNHKNYDNIHINVGSLSSIEILFFSWLYGIKKRILHSHSSRSKGYFFKVPTRKKLHYCFHKINKPIASLLANEYLACSQKSREWMFKNTLGYTKCKIVPNGIITDGFKYNEEIRVLKREELKISDSTKIIIHIGRFIPVKNHDFLLEIFKEFQKINPDSILIMVGEGENFRIIQDKIIKLGLKEKTILPGLQTDISNWLQAADIFVMPSLYEGLPVCLVEAQASGLPILTSDIVSKDVKLTDNLEFLSLKVSPNRWAAKINEMLSECRPKNNHESLVKTGYDINYTVNMLINDIYIY